MKPTSHLNLKPNLYFNIVAPDGAGKDSAMENIIPLLGNVAYFREPGGTPEAEIIRVILLTTDEGERQGRFDQVRTMDILPRTREFLELAEQQMNLGRIDLMEVYLYAASRSETSQKVVKKQTEQGRAVIGMRSVSCSMAYQVGARGIDADFVWDVNMKAIDRLPDFEIFLDVPTEIAMQRLAKRTGKQDRLDLEGEEFHRKSRQGYLDFFETNKFPVYKVDATKTIEEVTQQIYHIIKKNAL